MTEFTTKRYTLTAEKVAEIFQYHIQYVRILARTQKLPAIKRRRQWLFCEEEILEYFKENIEERHGRNERNADKASDLFH